VLKLPENLDPELFKRLVETNGGELTTKMGVEYLELSAEHSVARMPVEGNRQVVGILHGGAHVVLGESLGSISSAIHAGAGMVAMGIEVNATHTGAISEGWVVGTCDAISLSRTLATHEIIVREEGTGRRLSTVRITNILKEQRA
jgi:1,4-dihydroxy-2-naphthoyl-CoA hydrolase